MVAYLAGKDVGDRLRPLVPLGICVKPFTPSLLALEVIAGAGRRLRTQLSHPAAIARTAPPANGHHLATFDYFVDLPIPQIVGRLYLLRDRRSASACVIAACITGRYYCGRVSAPFLSLLATNVQMVG